MLSSGFVVGFFKQLLGIHLGFVRFFSRLV